MQHGWKQPVISLDRVRTSENDMKEKSEKLQQLRCQDQQLVKTWNLTTLMQVWHLWVQLVDLKKPNEHVQQWKQQIAQKHVKLVQQLAEQNEVHVDQQLEHNIDHVL